MESPQEVCLYLKGRYFAVGNLTMEAKQIHDKYADSFGAKFAEALLIAVTAEIDRKAK